MNAEQKKKAKKRKTSMHPSTTRIERSFQSDNLGGVRIRLH